MGSGKRRGVEFGCWLLLVACTPRHGLPAALEVVRFRQAGADGVFLNEALVVHLNLDLDPASVHRDSVRVLDGGGATVPGSFEVAGDRLFFRPLAPRRADLADGSFRPGQTYSLELRGFPAPDGLRSRAGVPLARAYGASFTTAAAGAALFEDPSLGRAEPLVLESTATPAGSPLRLRCSEPLDPRTVQGSDFELRRFTPAEGTAQAEAVRVPVEALLVENGGGGAALELWPLEAGGLRRALEPGEYHLWLDPRHGRPRDFGGHSVPTPWSAGATPMVAVQVLAGARGDPRTSARFDFLDASQRSSEAVAGAAGTASWSDTGLVELRFPAAAGSGRDGPLTVASELPEDPEATLLEVRSGEVLSLPPSGLVVWRAQGALSIAGRVERRVLDTERSWREGETPFQWRVRFERSGGAREVPEFDFRPGETLSDWLARAAAADPAWTVLIAGADLSISGEVRCDGPLLLVAGGWIRVAGAVSGSELWRSDPGYGFTVESPAKVLPLVLDPPLVNPLVEPLSLVVRSRSFRPATTPLRWHGEQVAQDQGDGRVRVQYLGERRAADGSLERIGPVDHPLFLGPSPSLQLSIELWLGPDPASTAWRPPRLDAVEVLWDTPDAP
jgi:hypothetical protein